MSETRGSNDAGKGGPDGRPGAGETIIDAKVEPISRLHWPRHPLRIVALLAGAVILSIAIAVAWQLWSTGRLDLAALTGARPVPAEMPAPAAGRPAPSTSPAPGAIAAQPLPADVLRPLAQRVDDLDRRITALTDGLDRLQQVSPGQTGATVSPQQLSDLATGLQGQMQSLMQARVQDVNKRLDALDKAVAALQSAKDETSADRIVVQQRMDEFDARLKAAVDNRAAALRAPVQQLLAWSELRDRARRGGSFAAQLPPLAALAEKAGGTAGDALRDALAALQPFAQSGVPTLAHLTGAFPAVAAKQSAAFREPGAEAAARPWWQRAIDKMTGLVSVRRIDAEADAATPDGKLAIAGAALRDGDLAAADAALDGMTLVPALAEWRQQAAARQRLDDALTTFAAALQTWFAAP